MPLQIDIQANDVMAYCDALGMSKEAVQTGLCNEDDPVKASATQNGFQNSQL